MNTERVKDAYKILAGIPADRYYPNLRDYTNKDHIDCGTLACGLGWLALHPTKFPEFTVDKNGDVLLNGSGFGVGFMESIFEGKRYVGVFKMRWHCLFDNEISGTDPSDKEMMLYRLRRLLGQPENTAFAGARADA